MIASKTDSGTLPDTLPKPERTKHWFRIKGIHLVAMRYELSTSNAIASDVTRFNTPLGLEAHLGNQFRFARFLFLESGMSVRYVYHNYRMRAYGLQPTTYTATAEPGRYVGTPSEEVRTLSRHEVRFILNLQLGLRLGSKWQVSSGPSVAYLNRFGGSDSDPDFSRKEQNDRYFIFNLQTRVRRQWRNNWYVEGMYESTPSLKGSEASLGGYGSGFRGTGSTFTLGLSKIW